MFKGRSNTFIMPAGGGMDFTYGQQNEVTGGPDAGEKSRPRARETAATYKNQFMSENLSKKVVGISRIANFQQLKDTSDLKELSIQGFASQNFLNFFNENFRWPLSKTNCPAERFRGYPSYYQQTKSKSHFELGGYGTSESNGRAKRIHYNQSYQKYS